MSGFEAIMADIGQFDAAFAPGEARRAGLEILPELTDTDFEIVKAEPEVTPKTRDNILRIGLKVLSGPLAGQPVEYAYFFKSQSNIDILGGDLATLGFDTDQWKAPARPFSKELVKALPRLIGKRFRGRTKKNGEYTNLYINAALVSGKPTTNGAPATYSPPTAQASGEADPF